MTRGLELCAQKKAMARTDVQQREHKEDKKVNHAIKTEAELTAQ